MRKYGHVFLTGVQGALVYRGNIFLRASFSLVHLVFVFSLWIAAFSGRQELGGYDLRETLTYFVAVFFCNFLIGAWSEDYQISEEIRNGTINQFLLRPVNYYAYRVSLFFASRLVTGAVALLPLLLIYPLVADYLTWPGEGWRLLALPAALVMAALIQFSIAFFYGLLAFWFLDIQGFVILSMALETTLSGQMFPLDLAPAAMQAFLQYQPFYYMMYFPVAVATGRLGAPEVASGLLVQVFWVLVLGGLCAAVWKRGLSRHTAVGG